MSARPLRAAAALLALAAARGSLAAQVDYAAAVDPIFAPWDRADSPGCAVGIVRDGRLVYMHGYGEANLDYGLPNGPEMVYYSGSVSKQFRAAAIALLVQDGVFALDDDIRRWFPERTSTRPRSAGSRSSIASTRGACSRPAIPSHTRTAFRSAAAAGCARYGTAAR